MLPLCPLLHLSHKKNDMRVIAIKIDLVLITLATASCMYQEIAIHLVPIIQYLMVNYFSKLIYHDNFSNILLTIHNFILAGVHNFRKACICDM